MKIKEYEQNRINKYKRKYEELLRWEKHRDRDREREQERIANWDTKRKQLIKDDLNYDSSEEQRRMRRYPKEY